ncbi:MAG: EAL domain-containing protein [Lachnospiraceae bacterium]|nr:EAL domain-containing protein [Lachnospiraceae bacterium]
MEKEFCRSNHVYIRYFKRDNDKYTREMTFEEWMSEAEKKYLENVFSPYDDLGLVERFMDSSPESIINKSTGDGAFSYGVCLRNPSGKIVGVAVFHGITEARVDAPKEIMTTNEEDLMSSISFFSILYETESLMENENESIRGALDEVQSESDKTSLLLKEKMAFSDILSKLESEGEFTEVAKSILGIAMKQLGFDEAALVGLDANGTKANIISECVSADVFSLSDKYHNLLKEDVPFFNGRRYTISTSNDLPEKFLHFFKTMNIKAGAFYPLYIREDASMYVQFISFTDRVIEHSEIKFMAEVTSVLQSILTRRITTNSLTSSYVTLEEILENAGCGMQVVDVEERRILYSNSIFKEMILNPKDKSEIEEILLTREDVVDQKTRFHATGTDKWYDITFSHIKWVDGRMVRLCTLYDISLLRQYQEKIEHQANTDYLTGLANRKRFELDLSLNIRRATRTGQNGAIILIGLDDFNNINDSLGHTFGDEMLRTVAETLEKIAASSATVYRIGGDEFVLLLSLSNSREMDAILHKIKEAFSSRWNVMDTECYCTASVGIAYYPIENDKSMAVFARADVALRDAKKHGKNQVSYFNASQKEASEERLSMEMALREAVDLGCNEFEVYYQPLVDISKEGYPCCGAEALVRWQSKKLGRMVMPNEFIPVAEHLGLILRIGSYVMLEAAKKCRHWNDFGHPEYKVNVNLSVSQLLQGNIVDTVEEVLSISGVNPKNLTLEVTESLAIYDIEKMTSILKDLHELGVRVALDDFGTGYSSLSYLKFLPLDVIKIDKCFVDQIGDNGFSNAFIDTVSKLANTINANVVVEGVEKKEQASVLSGMDIDMIQGYLYDKPLPQAEFEKKYVE